MLLLTALIVSSSSSQDDTDRHVRYVSFQGALKNRMSSVFIALEDNGSI